MVELITFRGIKEKSMPVATTTPNPARAADRSAHQLSETAIGRRIKSFFAQPRLVFNSLFLFVFSAAWIRELFYWFHTDAFGTSLNYWAYTDWLIDYSQVSSGAACRARSGGWSQPRSHAWKSSHYFPGS